MSAPGERALDHLRGVLSWPDLGGTRYELLGEVARGGMGVVYAARDLDLGREVALKVIAAEAADGEAAQRLRREASIIARLEHPGIVPVHDVGRLADGRVYYAMKLVSGKRLDELLRETPSLRERLRLLLRIAEPVAFAHARGVIHRDLKPENVMVGSFGEVLVMDWGVAKVGGEPGVGAPATHAGRGPDPMPRTSSVTAQGTILGTPAYMAPEQARGDLARVDARADVYALGAILYFMLSGHPPGRAPADSGAVTRTWARPRDPWPVGVAPLSPATGVPRPLQAICMKALAVDPDARYRDALEFAADVQRFLEGERVEAYPEGPWRRLTRIGRRHRTPILLVLAYLVMRAVLLLTARI